MGLAYFESPIGTLAITGTDNEVSKVQFVDSYLLNPSEKTPEEVQNCMQQLDEYFSGKRKSFSIKLHPGGTYFQKKVWKELADIKFGLTLSYLDLAKKVGDPESVRAVGKANGQNPIVIIIPCHRVVGIKGDLTGYIGGIKKKEWLLNHENAVMPDKQLSLFG